MDPNPYQDSTILFSLSKCKTLQKLDVQSNNIIKALKENSSVRELSCNVEFTSDDAVDDFCTLLQQNGVLEEIYLQVCDGVLDAQTTGIDRNYLQVESMPVASFNFLKQIMETVCSLTLKKFVISKQVDLIASNDTIMAICKVLQNNKYLEYLHLPKLRVEPRQSFLQPIANALSKNSCLTTLVLEFLPTNMGIFKPLDYKNIFITSEDTKAVGYMLKINKTLRFLHLMVDIPDWFPIIEGLKLNTTIRELHIPSSAKKSVIKCIDYDHVRSRIKYRSQKKGFLVH